MAQSVDLHLESIKVADVAGYPDPPPEIRENLKKREDWVDLLKGIGILLVVLGHALGGLIDSGAADANTWFRPLFAAIYVFHMPLFFFLSGLFVANRLERGRRRFVRGLAESILLPYVLWSAIQVTMIWAAGNMVNHPADDLGWGLLAILYSPPSQFWFLYGLMLLHLASALAGPRTRDPVFLVFALVAGSLAELHFMPGLAKAILYGVPYYALGVVFGPRIVALPIVERLSAAHWGLIVAAPLAVALAMYDAFDKQVPPGWRHEAAGMAFQVNGFQKFFAAALAIAALGILARRLEKVAPRLLVRCGQLTMPIFLVHVICIAGTRILLPKFTGPISPEALLPMLVVAGVAGPLLAYTIASRLRLLRPLGFG